MCRIAPFQLPFCHADFYTMNHLGHPLFYTFSFLRSERATPILFLAVQISTYVFEPSDEPLSLRLLFCATNPFYGLCHQIHISGNNCIWSLFSTRLPFSTHFFVLGVTPPPKVLEPLCALSPANIAIPRQISRSLSCFLPSRLYSP